MAALCLQKCCICISLRVGGLILGYILTIIKALMFFLALVHANLLRMVIAQNNIHDPKTNFILFLMFIITFLYALEMIMGISLLTSLHKIDREKLKKFYKVYPVIFVIYFIIFLISFLMNVKTYTSTEWLFHLADVSIWILELYTVFIVYRYAVYMKQQTQQQYMAANSRPLNTNFSIPPAYYDA